MMLSNGMVVLLVVLAAGLIGGNDLVSLAAVILLALQAVGSVQVLGILEESSIRVGVLFLFIGVLVPFSTGRLGLSSAADLWGINGLIALSMGIIASILAGHGVALLQQAPETMLGFVVGSVVGVTFLGGVPAGPIVAAGMAALLMRWVR